MCNVYQDESKIVTPYASKLYEQLFHTVYNGEVCIGTEHSATISMKYLKHIQGVSIMIIFSAEPRVSFATTFIIIDLYIFWVMFTSSGAPHGPLYKLSRKALPLLRISNLIRCTSESLVQRCSFVNKLLLKQDSVCRCWYQT